MLVSHPDPQYQAGAPNLWLLWVLAANGSHLHSCLEVCPWLIEAGSGGGYKSHPLGRHLGQGLTSGRV